MVCGSLMICALSLSGIALGATLAYAAHRIPSRIAFMETAGGVFLIAGLALLGSALPPA
jgi:hypothetical protein